MKYFVFCIKKIALLSLVLVILLNTKYQILNTLAYGQTMKNDSFIIQMGNLNELSGTSTGSGYSLSQTGGELGAGLYSGTNYKARAGFQYISSIIKFRFTISQTSIDFGTLTPTNPVTRANTLTVSNQSAGGYSVKAFENHPLMVPTTGATIPDTTCDNGSCSEITASSWTSTLTYGFGYRCDFVDSANFCPSDFSGENYYKQFADVSKNEKAQTIMTGTTGRNHKSQITYKVNISATQQAGLYSNTVTYIATPTY